MSGFGGSRHSADVGTFSSSAAAGLSSFGRRDRPRLPRLGAVALMVAALGGCGRTTAPDSSPDGSVGQGGSGAGGSVTAGTAGTIGDPPLCTENEPAAAPIALLDERQLVHVAALFEESYDSGGQPPSLSRIFNDEGAQLTSAFVESQFELAARIAREVVADSARFARVVGCDFEKLGAEACLPPLKDFVLRRLFRGLAAEGTADELQSVFDWGTKLGGDPASGLRAVLEVALQSPELLYRVEFGRPSDQPDGWAEPTQHEMASRLSFLLWDRGPDDELLAAADAGELKQPEQLAAQARRLLQDSRARTVVRRFYEELLRVGYAHTSDSRVPELTPAIYADMRSELGAFVEEATFDGAGDFSALFAPVTWVNQSLAQFYGFQPVAGAEFQRVKLDSARYAGLVTQGAWLTSIGGGSTSPTRRGLVLMRALMCQEVPPEPPGLEVTIPEPVPTPATIRERLAAHVAPPCVACHQLMDPYGLALEHFDRVGRWRDTEEGLPIDTAVTVSQGDSVDGSAELAAWLLAQPRARDCFVQNWRSFAFGRGRVDVDDCEQAELLQRFRETDENVVELLVALTQSNSFRYLGKARP